MNKLELIIKAISVTFIFVAAYLVYDAGKQLGIEQERTSGQAVQERAAAIDACAREANVYPESCQMKAVVVTPREEQDKAAALLPFPVGMKG